MKSTTVIITAGGTGKRMGGNLPKQFLPLAGKPILMQTLKRFSLVLPTAEFILTLPSVWHQEWIKLCREHNFLVPHTTIDGGEERFHSVKNALNLATGEIVLIHDAVRPLFSKAFVLDSIRAVETNKGIIPVTGCNESLRQFDPTGTKSVDRSNFRLVQTPQVFITNELKNAYLKPYKDHYTDDASVFEENGGEIVMLDGNRENIKITSPIDLEIAELFWKNL